MGIGPKGLELIRQFEGLRKRAYKDPVGIWTIGYGHTKGVSQGMRVTEDEALDLLRADLEAAEDAVRQLVQVRISSDQRDALISFVFNVGAGAFKRSTLLRVLNEGRHIEVPTQLLRWTKGGGKVLKGLVRRRLAEATLWVG